MSDAAVSAAGGGGNAFKVPVVAVEKLLVAMLSARLVGEIADGDITSCG